MGTVNEEEASARIEVLGARVNNLKNVDVSMPRHALTVITGLSGSGKSSLAFDTLFAEGQRRYIETFSAYARGFIGHIERPDVDEITGLSPVISIEQKTTNRNPRSTVGTVTEVYDYLRLLYARAATAYSYVSGERMVRYTEEQVLALIMQHYDGRRIALLSPVVRGRKGHYKELFENIRRRGYLMVRVDGVMSEARPGMKLDRYRTHDVEVVVDRLRVEPKMETRLKSSLATAMHLGDGLLMVMDIDTNEVRHYSRRLMDPVTGLSYREPAPHNFSFNSPQGACPRCKGLGAVSCIDMDKVVPDRTLSVADGAIAPLGKWKNQMVFWQIAALLERYEATPRTPVEQLPPECLDEIVNGTQERLRIKSNLIGTSSDYFVAFEGVAKYISSLQDREPSAAVQKWADQFARQAVCPACGGARLCPESLAYRFADRNISELCAMDISELVAFLEGVEDRIDDRQRHIAAEILKEIRYRLRFLVDVGLDYLSLSRAAASLSGGESQRIRLATQIGSQLVGVLYILDEPSIGLHQRDNQRLIHSLKELRDGGNTVVVVEHDRDMMLAADYVVDMGPRAGRLGGHVVFQGSPRQMLQANTLTADYLNGRRTIPLPRERRTAPSPMLTLHGCRGNNLKNISVSFPLGRLICVTGVSGSGKSSLVNETLQPILSQRFYRSLTEPLPYDGIEGLEHVDKVICVDQSPLGRSPRSNPATYTGVFADIRNLFVSLPEAKMRGYKPGRFSFNVAGGRCEECQGNGYRTIEMNFLPDVFVPCPICHGRRYNRETLEVRFKGKSIADVLDMTIDEAVPFFENQPTIIQKIGVLQEVGLGYIKLGQSSTTLSGGESQRVKLATELSKRDTGRTVYILDEPTTGLHFEDIRILMGVLDRLVEKGNTVIVIEHNMDVIRLADYVIDMGPEGGRGGGYVLSAGTPEQVAMCTQGYTPTFLKQELGLNQITNNKAQRTKGDEED